MREPYKEKETGKLFILLCFGISCTGGRNEAVIIYHPVDDGNTIYVKEYGEFCREFVPLGEENDQC
jgi:hypothetical protein